MSALDSLISAWFSALSFIASTSVRLTIVLAFFSCSLSSPPLSSLSLSSIALMSSLCLLMVSAVSRSCLARDSSSGRPYVGGGGLLWCRLCSNPRGSVSIELSSATDRRPFGVISPDVIEGVDSDSGVVSCFGCDARSMRVFFQFCEVFF